MTFFSQVRGQLLLLDPIPPINKVFSLVSQEERQRTISSQASSVNRDMVNSMAFSAHNEQIKSFGTRIDNNKKSYNDYSGGNRFQKKDKQFCTNLIFEVIRSTDVTSYMAILLDISKSKKES